MRPLRSPPSSDPESFLTWVSQERKFTKEGRSNRNFPFTILLSRKCGSTKLPCQPTRQKAAKFYGTVSCDIAIMVRMDKMQIKVDCFDSRGPICFIGFLDTIKLACNANRIQKGAVMWVSPVTSTAHLRTHSTVLCVFRTHLLLPPRLCAMLTSGLANCCGHTWK